MARGRMISKSLGASKRFMALHEHAGPLAEFAAALFCLVISNCDDFGRCEADAASIRWRCWPSSPRTEREFAMALEALHNAGLICWYQVEGNHILEVTRFSEHQSGLHKRTRSKFPDAPGYRAESISSNNHSGPETPASPLEKRALHLLSDYLEQHNHLLEQPYLQNENQRTKDLASMQLLVAAYQDADVSRIVKAFLQLDEENPKNKLLRGCQRTVVMLQAVYATQIAKQLKIKAANL